MHAETGERLRVRADYAVGADGSRSTLRGLLGIRMQGQHAYAQNINLVIRAPQLREAFAGGRSIMYWLVNPDCAAIAGPMDLGDTWYFGFPLPNGAPTPDEAGLRARMAAAFGRDVSPEILTIDTWAAHSLIADRYREGRVFLAGDACHLHPPFGGYGMNIGIADGVDLGWKLAARLRGWGGEGLLDSYEAERRPVHRRVIDEAVANYAMLATDLLRDGLESDGPEGDRARATAGALILEHKLREFRTLGVVLGSHYSGSPVTVPDGTAPPEARRQRLRPERASGLPRAASLAEGRKLPLRPLRARLHRPRRGARERPGRGPARPRRRPPGHPLALAAPGDARLAPLYEAPLALIRPDGFVAWRGALVDARPRPSLRTAAGLSPRPTPPESRHAMLEERT